MDSHIFTLVVFLLALCPHRSLSVAVTIVMPAGDDVTGSILYPLFHHLTIEHKLFLHIVTNSVNII